MKKRLTKISKKTLGLVLACVLTTLTLLGGSSTNYYAADHKYETWETLVTNPTSTLKTSNLCLYIGKERYHWAVTSHYCGGGYGQVTLSEVNALIEVEEGKGKVLSQEGHRYFRITHITINNPDYARFKVIMDYDGYPTRFSGYAEALDN